MRSTNDTPRSNRTSPGGAPHRGHRAAGGRRLLSPRASVPEEGEDRIHRLRTQVRHTTVIVLPADENILDFVVGDSEYWHLTGAANVAFLKPLSLRTRRRTSRSYASPGAFTRSW